MKFTWYRIDPDLAAADPLSISDVSGAIGPGFRGRASQNPQTPSSCNPALRVLLKFLRSPFDAVSSMGFSVSPPSALLASRNRRECCTDELGARAAIQLVSRDTNALRRRCGNKFSVEAQKRSTARQWAGGLWYGELRCAPGLHSSWMWSRPLTVLHSCSARPPLHPWLTIRCGCAVCGRRLLLLLLWSQDRRAGTARRCG